VQREVEAVGAARAALETRQGEGEGVVAELEGQVEGFVSGWSSKIEALGATVDEATAALASRSDRAHELGLRQQQAQQAELDEAVAQIAAVQRATATELRRGEAHMSTAVHAVQAAHAMVAQRTMAGGVTSGGAPGGINSGSAAEGLAAPLEALRRLLERAPAPSSGDGADPPPLWHARRGAAEAAAAKEAEAAAEAEAEAEAYAAQAAAESESFEQLSRLLLAQGQQTAADVATVGALAARWDELEALLVADAEARAREANNEEKLLRLEPQVERLAAEAASSRAALGQAPLPLNANPKR